ncbi:aminotransferase class I/II-fold pyridoxal phosphate-dependent enzyme, partial [Alphaproteobacteria bacterium]|nr:aminotransferase class I/II-fold pyridoxal phosphate-dependent enzyme [Alphaproteobacteria bacterium]
MKNDPLVSGPTIAKHASHEAAMRLLTDLSQSILAVVDSDGILLGVITDGDIRRALIGGTGISDTIVSTYNSNPIYGYLLDDDFKFKRIMEDEKVDRLPIVDSRHRFIRFEFAQANTIPNAIPQISHQELSVVHEALKNVHVAVGPNIGEFERHICDFTNARFAVATNSGTAALHLALLVCNVLPGDLVITPTFTFAATANVIKYLGAEPLFFDIDKDTLCIDVDQVEQYLKRECEIIDGVTQDKDTGRVVKAILPVHIYGHPACMTKLMSLAKEFSLELIEDGAEALGASYRGKKIGSIGKICALSFNGNKIITTGGGGMVLTNCAETAARARSYANQSRADSIEFLHKDIGFNYRMPNINAALGCAQVAKLSEFVEEKRSIVNSYIEGFRDLEGLSMVGEASGVRSSFWMAVLRLDLEQVGFESKDILKYLISKGIGARPTWYPLHLQTAFASASKNDMRKSLEVYRETLCLPCSTNLSQNDINLVVKEVK